KAQAKGREEAEAHAAAGELHSPPRPVPPAPPPALTRRMETQAERDIRRVTAKLLGKRIRVRGLDFDSS
ncbi:MAG: hypothetical protein U1E45_21490, partial [Geminicoccaceae bacterium]